MQVSGRKILSMWERVQSRVPKVRKTKESSRSLPFSSDWLWNRLQNFLLCFCRKIGSRETAKARVVLSVLTALAPAMSIYDVAWQLHIYLSVRYPVKCFQKQKPCLLFGSGQSNNWCYLDADSSFRLSSFPNSIQRKWTMCVNRIMLSLLQCFKISRTDMIEFILPWLLINAHKILSLTIQILFYSLTPIFLFVSQINSCFEIFLVAVVLFSKCFSPLNVFIAFPIILGLTPMSHSVTKLMFSVF